MSAGLAGAGLGLRRSFSGELVDCPDSGAIAFLELAPENWIGVGGRYGAQLQALAARYPLVAHGLSLSLGGPAPLDETLLHKIRGFLDAHGITLYSEHLSWCSDGGQLYDLLPIPFTTEAVRHVAARIRRAQDILQRRIAVENVSYYAAPGAEMSEPEFINAVLDEADCLLLLDVNNVYVNSVDHVYDADEFLARLPAGRIAYLHVAGHFAESDTLLIDTHGAAVPAPVWALLERAYARFGALPTLLERDFNFPPLPALIAELDRIRGLQAARAQRDCPRRRAG